MTLLIPKAQRPPFQNFGQLTLWAYASLYAAAAPAPPVAGIPAKPATTSLPAVSAVPPIPAKPGVPAFLTGCSFQADNAGVNLGFKFAIDQPAIVAGMEALSLISQIKPISTTIVAPSVNYAIAGSYAVPDEPAWCNTLERFLAWGAYHCKTSVAIAGGLLTFQAAIPTSDLGAIDLVLATLPGATASTNTVAGPSAAAIPALIPFTNAPFDNSSFWADADAGDDSTGDGSKPKPFKTIARLIAEANKRLIVSNFSIVLKGHFNEDVDLRNLQAKPYDVSNNGSLATIWISSDAWGGEAPGPQKGYQLKLGSKTLLLPPYGSGFQVNLSDAEILLDSPIVLRGNCNFSIRDCVITDNIPYSNASSDPSLAATVTQNAAAVLRWFFEMDQGYLELASNTLQGANRTVTVNNEAINVQGDGSGTYPQSLTSVVNAKESSKLILGGNILTKIGRIGYFDRSYADMTALPTATLAAMPKWIQCTQFCEIVTPPGTTPDKVYATDRTCRFYAPPAGGTIVNSVELTPTYSQNFLS